jgi:hypothetical protein
MSRSADNASAITHGKQNEAECMMLSAMRYKSQRHSVAFRCVFVIEVLPQFATAASHSRLGES